MKYFLFLFLLCANAAFAQAPQGFSYQAIANNANGTPVVSGNVKTRISILDNTATGAVLYTETHAPTTNAQGLFNLTIGQGTPATGTFAAISWGGNPKFVKVELDPAGGTNYTTVGTSQLQSVPYSLYADKVNPAGLTNAVNTALVGSKFTTTFFDDYSADKIYAHSTKTGVWALQTYTTLQSPTVIDSCGFLMFDDYTADKIFVYNGQTSIWSSQTYTTLQSPTIQTRCGLYFFDDYAADKIFIYNGITSAWTSQSYATGQSPTIQLSNNTLIFDDYTADKIYIYSIQTGSWSSQSYSTLQSPTVRVSEAR